MASQDNPQLLFTLSDPPTDSYGHQCRVRGVVMLENFVYVVYMHYNKVEVFDCEYSYKKIKDIEVEEMEDPQDMVGSSVTSQLFISDYPSDVIRRVDSNTGVGDVFIRPPDGGAPYLSLVDDRLLVPSRDSLMIYNIASGERIKSISLTEYGKNDVVMHAVESNRYSFFVIHGPSGSDSYKLNEIDSEGRVIRVFNNEEHLRCVYLALESVGRLLVADDKNSSIVLLDEHLKFKRIFIDNKRLKSPLRLAYNKNNNRLAVGLWNGQVKIFECKM